MTQDQVLDAMRRGEKLLQHKSIRGMISWSIAGKNVRACVIQRLQSGRKITYDRETNTYALRQ